MSQNDQDQSIESILKDFEKTSIDSNVSVENAHITIWLPLEYKAKYDALQAQSRRRFGRVLREVIKRSIEKVSIENEAV